jgi:transposase
MAAIRERGRTVEIAMEPTGVYGDALCHQLLARGFDVYRVDPKRCHDIASVLDGVASQHDAKSCTLIAYLHAQGISARWRVRSDLEQQARSLVDLHALFLEPLDKAYGRIEALTSAHWPELNAMIDQRTAWYLHLLAAYPSPRHVAANVQHARELLRRKTFGALSAARISEVIDSASRTLGAPLSPHQCEVLQVTVEQILAMRERIKSLESRMSSLCELNTALSRIAHVVGPAAATVLFAYVGDPARYSSAAAFEKACGLNLRERSSGNKQGKLHITKRGPARVRRYLFLAALRMILQSQVMRAWYQRRSSYLEGHKHKAVVAVMRKLTRALYHVAQGHHFDVDKLIDVRRLRLDDRVARSSELAARS